MPGTKVGIEEIPLLTSDGEPKKDAEHDEESDAIPDNPEEDKILFAEGQRRGTNLLISDAIILILEALQFFALIQSLSFRWAWPVDWLNSFSFLFAFNLDIWEMVKISTNGTYKSVKFYNTPSGAVPLEYWQMVLMWSLICALGGIAFIAAYSTMRKKKSSYMLIQIAVLQKVYVIAIQVTAIPVGVMVGKLFHCADSGMVDVSNDLYCFQGAHWAYLFPSILFLLAFYILFPVWLIKTTKKETLGLKHDSHEGYLQLKETEYLQGMDMIYIVANYHVFSSFRKSGTHYRAFVHILKFVVVIFYALLFQYVNIQAVVLTLIFFFMFLACVLIRPFRVQIFNTMLILNYFMLCANSLIGAMIASFNSYNVQSVWFTPDYSFYVLIFIQGLWFLLTLIFLLYITLRHFMLCVCVKRPLWPSIMSNGLDNISATTKKYIRGTLRARLVLDKALSMPPLFAPVHELARQIQIINAYTREAEMMKDPLHDTLWDLLDELIDVHSSLSPKSLFSESIKDSIRETANKLMKMMPVFAKKVNERDYDFILVNPVKKRMILKMYCLGIFLNGRSDKLKKERQYKSAMLKLYTHEDRNEVDDGYYEDMYPAAPEINPQLRKNFTGVIIDLESDAEDDRYLEEVENWTSMHPMSRPGTSNTNDEINTILSSDDSIDFNALMAGVPSLPGTPPTSARSLYSPGRGTITQTTTMRLGTLEEQPTYEDSPLIEEITYPGSSAGFDNDAFNEVEPEEEVDFGEIEGAPSHDGDEKKPSKPKGKSKRKKSLSKKSSKMSLSGGEPRAGRRTSVTSISSFKAPSDV
ncbi:uncharacterized protein LOC135486661 [Lineus longissimus]|uniref:uncharacterized protein LOC135486661 n=1 Tax=Lineus longissimus TaxID=88925 RepID=UPI002B4E0808